MNTFAVQKYLCFETYGSNCSVQGMAETSDDFEVKFK